MDREHIVKVNEIYKLTHNIVCIVTERPEYYHFSPGQATEIAINRPGWDDQSRPFTFTSLPEDNFLQFIIKIYSDHDGVTNQLKQLKIGDELILHDVFGTITYKGKGTFIAGGAGITPFISIFRNLKQNNKINGNRLIFANQSEKDILLKNELKDYFNNDFVNILSKEKSNKYSYGLITKRFLEKNITDRSDKVYLCGPPQMNKDVKEKLINIGIIESNLIMEGI